MALLETGTVLSRYTILGKLATGGMAEVYLARQEGASGFQKLMVLKVILPHLAEDPEFLNMFHNEAKLAALLNHPNVVQIFDFGVDHCDGEKIQYMAMEYIDGLNFRRIVMTLEEEGSSLPQSIAIRIISDACSALEYAHSLTGLEGNNLEVIHRDVSLENILLTYTGQVKLVDFGIAKARNLESHTSVGALRGKYRYMAPEQIRGDKLDNRADIYSMGVVLYRLLLGQLPFDAGNHAQLIDRIVNRPPPRPRDLRPDLPEELERITLKALNKDRDRRYQRATEFQIDLEAHLLATGDAVMPYNLSRFMTETFPAGRDELRVRYQKLSGVSSGTPPEARRPAQALKPEVLTSPLPKVPTPAMADDGADNPELFKATVIGDDELLASTTAELDPDRAPMEPPLEALPTDPLDAQPTRPRLAKTEDMTADDFITAAKVVMGDMETQIGDLEEIFGDKEPTTPAEPSPSKPAAPPPTPDPPIPTREAEDTEEIEEPMAAGANETQIGDLEEIFGKSEPTPADTPPQHVAENEQQAADFQASKQTVPEDGPGQPEPALSPIEEETKETAAPPGPPVTADEDDSGGLEAAETKVHPTEFTQEKSRSLLSRPGFWIGLVIVLLGAGSAIYFLAISPGEKPVPKLEPGTRKDPPPPPKDTPPQKPKDDPPPKPKDDPPPASPADAGTEADSSPDTGAPSDQSAPAPDLPPPDLPPPAPDMPRPDQPPPPKPAASPDAATASPTPPGASEVSKISVSCALGGTVYLDKKPIGRVPLREKEVPAGKHRLQLRSKKHGFRVTRSVNMKPGQHQRLTITPRQGTIRIMVRPWAKVTLDGKVLGTTPLQPVKAYEGRHRLLLENSNLKAKKKVNVNVRPGKEAVVKVRLGQ